MLFFGNSFLLLVGILFSSLVEGQPIPRGCVDITIPVTITAQNLALPTTLDVTDFFTILEPIIAQPALTTVSGTFNIAATYCEPVTTNTTLFNTLQLLVHGYASRHQFLQTLIKTNIPTSATYTKSYWFGEYYSQSNSWVSHNFKVNSGNFLFQSSRGAQLYAWITYPFSKGQSSKKQY